MSMLERIGGLGAVHSNTFNNRAAGGWRASKLVLECPEFPNHTCISVYPLFISAQSRYTAMSHPLKEPVIGPDLSPETIRRVDILFPAEARGRVKDLLYQKCGKNLPFLEKMDMFGLERFRFAALKYSDGKFSRLEHAVKLAQTDWRDLLAATDFANDVGAHRNWEPMPVDEPARIDTVAIAAEIHKRVAEALTPLAFRREGEEWRRDGEVPQTLRLQTGLTSRVETRFFLRITLEATPVSVLLHLPLLPASMKDMSEQGYRIKAQESEEALYGTVMGDVVRYCLPWFERFTTNEEVQRGFEDGTFKRHLPMGSQALVFSV
jgi:hypothetical protein